MRSDNPALRPIVGGDVIETLGAAFIVGVTEKEAEDDIGCRAALGLATVR